MSLDEEWLNFQTSKQIVKIYKLMRRLQHQKKKCLNVVIFTFPHKQNSLLKSANKII